jgi:phosphoglycerate dehydrogenase-like enzyme
MGPSNIAKSKADSQIRALLSSASGAAPRIVDNHTISSYGVNMVSVGDPPPAAPARGRPVVTVLCAGDRPTGLEAVEERAEVRHVSAAGLRTCFGDTDVLLLWDFTSRAVPAAWREPHRLAWLHVAAAGVDNVLCDPLRDSGTVLTNSRGVFEAPIAEYVLGLLLAFTKDLPGTLADQAARRWRHRETERLAGRTALVVGTGPIGRATGRLLRAAGLRVSGIGRTGRAGDPDLGTVHPFDRLLDHLPEADFVVLAAPLTAQTAGMVDARALAAMRPTARLVNVGRGPLVVTADLVAALRAGRLAGAALDVFDTEPLPADSPLWTIPGVVVSPHMSGDVTGWRDALAELFVANFLRWQAGEPLRNVVDKRLGYVPTGGLVG